MSGTPLKLLVAGYGASLAAASVIDGALASVAVFWIGGAVATLAGAALISALRKDGDARRDEAARNAEAEALRETLRRWDEDIAQDRRPPIAACARADAG